MLNAGRSTALILPLSLRRYKVLYLNAVTAQVGGQPSGQILPLHSVLVAVDPDVEISQPGRHCRTRREVGKHHAHKPL